MPDLAYVDAVVQVLHQWDHLGTQSLPDGTVLIGRVPQIAPEAWLHKLFAPATPEQRSVLSELPTPVHTDFADFLTRVNGLSVFSGYLSIYGLRSSYARRGDGRWQPFDVRTPNTLERIKHAPQDALFVGSSFHAERLLAISSISGEVVESTRDQFTILRRWRSFSTMLLGEIERMATFCDAEGSIREPLSLKT